jgi:capsular exopolysaccharide synthesis family protein
MNVPATHEKIHPPARDSQSRAPGPDQLSDLVRSRGEMDGLQFERLVQQHRERHLAMAGQEIGPVGGKADAFGTLTQLLHTPYAPFAGDWQGDPELVVAADPFHQQAEIFRELRAQLLAKALARSSRAALAVVSPDRGDGRSYVAANLAACLGQLGGRTLLIDADLRSPRLHRLLGPHEGVGLSSILGGHVDDIPLRQASRLPGLFFIPAGDVPPNPVDLLQGPRFSLLLYEMLSKFDHVVLDSPADALGADARLIAAKAGAALVVGRKGRSSISTLRQLLGRLENGPAEVAGVLLNQH